MNISNWSIWGILSLGCYSARKKQKIEQVAELPNGYVEYYNSKILPLTTKFETKRLTTLRITGLMSWAIILDILFCIYFFHITNFLYIKIMLALAGLLFLGIVFFTRKYQEVVYQEVLTKIIGFYGDFSFSLICPIKAKSYNDYRIIPSHSRESNKNYITGQHKGIKIEQFYSTLSKRIDKENYVQVFAGLILKLEFSKQFNGMTIIKKDHGLFNIINFEAGLEHVRLEDPIFEKEFEVFASDQVEARYILTTVFMERLLEFKKAMQTKSLVASFYQNNLLLLIARPKPLFKSSTLSEPADFISDSQLLLPEIEYLLKTIDILKLDQKIGL